MMNVSYNRLRWACRRGMLELDLMLLPFFEARFASLSKEQQAVFERLLGCTDPELFAWLMGHETPEDKDLLAMVKVIQHHAQTQS